MKSIRITFVLILFTTTMFGQRFVFPGQNLLYRFLEDPSYISINKNYNITGTLQASDSKMAQTSQYFAAQLSFFENMAFGVDYSKHSFDSYRYSHILFSGRARLGLGNEYHYLNLGFSVGPDKSHELGTATENSLSTSYRLGAHYTNYNFTIGGFMNRYPLQNELLINNNVQLPTTINGYSIYASYNIALFSELRLTPTVRYNAYDYLNFFEGIATFNYQGKFEMALSYKNDYSINPQLGAQILKRMKLSYSYEKSMGSQQFKDVHAIGLSVNLGSKATDDPEWLANVKKKHAKVQRISKPTQDSQVNNIAIEEKIDLVIDEDVVAISETNKVSPKPMSNTDPEDIIDNRLKPGHYIIVGSFKVIANATKEVERLNRKGYYARIGKKDASSAFNYVYVDRYSDKKIALDRIKEIKKEKGLENTWLLTID
jgi:hypothetical protein